jgi:acetylornithine deacetylase/succinyl-diaminopimelate desuccinylase-like protein
MDGQISAYLKTHAERFLGELKDWLRIPTVSADPAFHADVLRGAEFLRSHFETLGMTSRLVETPGNPVVVAEWMGAPGAPTALVYGHYDVQPPDPLDLWTTPAFEPTVRDGKLFARGATDDKGQVFTHVKSVEAWLKTVGRLPINVRFVVEGEEEVGSENLEDFLRDHRDELKCDIAVVSDTSQYAPGIPAITYGLRGIFACEVTVFGPRKDLHSGVFGGSVANPAVGLAKMLSKLHDDAGRIQIPGFYDDVLPLTAEERQQFAGLPFDEAAYLSELGATAAVGEAGYTTLERRWARPTCEVNGLFSGYTGVGPKTIVPARATAKITCRLVANQDPKKLVQSLEQFLRANLPTGLTMEFHADHGAPAFLFHPDSPYIDAARTAIEQAFGARPVLIREGGSIPVVTTFRQVLGVDTLLLGWGQNTDNLHSPDEHFSVADFQRGIHASAELWECLANVPQL